MSYFLYLWKFNAHHSPHCTHLDCVNYREKQKIAENFWETDFISFGYKPRHKIAWSEVVLSVNFEGMTLFSIMDVPMCSLINNQEWCFLYFPNHTLLPLLPFAGRNSNRFGTAFIVILICIFLMINDGGNFLHFFLYCPQSSACLLLRYICSGPLPFLIGLSSLMLWNRSSSSCILDINPLSYRRIANIFSQVVFLLWLLFPVLQRGSGVQCHSTCLFLHLLPLLSGSPQKHCGPMSRSFPCFLSELLKL